MQLSTLACRFAALAAVAGAAVSANAWILEFGGTYQYPNTDHEQITILYEYSDLLHSFQVNDFTYSYGGGLSSGFLDASSLADGTLDLNFSGIDTASGGTHSMAGDWIANFPETTANTGATGTYSASFDGIGDFEFTLVGQNATPEPTTLAAMAMGIGAFIIRRRKRA